MAIFENINEVKEFISINQSYDFDEIRPYINKAIRKYIKPFCGNLAKEVEEEFEGADAEMKNEIRTSLQEAIINFAFYLNTPIGVVNYTADGISVSDSENYRAASNAQVNDLKRDFLRSGHEALDETIRLLNESPELFTEYNQKYLPKNRNLIVQNTSEFHELYFIHHSRQTYLALIPLMRRVEDQYINSYLCEEFLEFIKVNEVTGPVARVLLLLKKAVVAFTISKAVYEGQFIIDSNGIHLKFDVLPHEKVVTNINLKINDFLIHTRDSQETAGFEYLSQVQTVVESNPSEFQTYCGGNVIITNTDESTSGSSFKPYDTKSILGI